MPEVPAPRAVLTAWTPRISEQIAQLYRDLHRHPELSMQEHHTAAAVVAALEPLGLDVTAGVGGTGVVAVLRNGDGPVVMLRADMDALPVAEATGLPYASTAVSVDAAGSTVAVAHACGHDMHTASLVDALFVRGRGAVGRVRSGPWRIVCVLYDRMCGNGWLRGAACRWHLALTVIPTDSRPR